MYIQPTTIDWRITSKCNNSCPFCYASAQKKELSELEIDKIFNKLSVINPDHICITGGEPTLSKNFDYIIKKAIQYHYNIYLSSNGTNFFEKTIYYLDSLSKLSLPLDGYDVESYSINGRNSNGFENIKKILDYLKENPNYRCKVKITTMITAKNKNPEFFEKMLSFLRKYPIDIWKIYQFIPEGKGANYYSEYYISDNDYNLVEQNLNEICHDDDPNFIIDFAKRSQRQAAYFIIQPDGTVMIPVEQNDLLVEEIMIGDLKDGDITEIVKKWNQYINLDNYEKNIKRRGPGFALDTIDQHLISEIDHDPLATDEQLKNKINSILNSDYSLQYIKNRIDILFNKNVIKQIIPVMNTTSFGLGIHLANLTFENGIGKKDLIIDYLKNFPYTVWLVHCEALDSKMRYIESQHLYIRIGLLVRYDNDKICNDSDLTMKDLLGIIRNDFKEFKVMCEEDNVYKKYIREQKFILDNEEKYFSYDKVILSSNCTKKVSSKEYLVLKCLADLGKCGRISYDVLSAQTNLSIPKLKAIIEKLKNDKIINKFQVVLNMEVIDHVWYLYFIRLKNNYRDDYYIDEINKIENENSQDSVLTRKITHINCLNKGNWDLDFEIKIRNNNEKTRFDEFLNRKFGKIVDEFKVYHILKEYKFEFLTPLIFDRIKIKHKFFEKLTNISCKK